MAIFHAPSNRESCVIVTVSKWGNSLGLRIPRGIASDANLAEGSSVDVRIEKGRIVIEPVHSSSLEELLARVTPANRHGDEWHVPPVGGEAL
jgi:antitoxin MazE